MYTRNADFDTDLAVAADPAIDERQMESLLRKHHGEFAMADALARNPACPYRLFISFWLYQVPAAQENPALSEHRAHPHWEQTTRHGPRVKYHKYSFDVSERRPESYKLRYLMEHGDGVYQRFIMALENIPEELVRSYAGSKSAPLRKTIASRETAPDEVFEQLSKDSARTVRQALAANPHAPPRVLATLASDEDEAVANAARNNPACPDDAVHRARLADAPRPELADSDIAKLKFADLARLAVESATPIERLEQLAAHDDPCVRFLTGINPSTPAATLTRLAADPVDWVRASAAFNPATPPAVLTGLLDSKLRDIQLGLASNPSLPEPDQIKLASTACSGAAETLANLTNYASVWEALAKDVDVNVPSKKKGWRHFLAEALAARKTGKFTSLQRGFRSRYLFVSRIAARSEKCPDSLAGHYAHYAFADYSQNPQAALALLEGRTHVTPVAYQEWKLDKWLGEGDAPGHVANYYIRSDHAKRRAQAVSNWTTQLLYLLPLVLDPETNTRKRLARRKDLIRFMFEMLARDDKPGVREEIAKNPRTPSSVLQQLTGDKATVVRAAASKRLPKSASRKGSQGQFVNQGSATERARLAKNTEEAALLRELAGDRAVSVRTTVAANQSTPGDVLARLAHDKDSKVRIVVAQHSRERDLLRQMLDDNDKAVRVAAASRTIWRTYSNGVGYLYDAEFLSWNVDAPDEEVRAIVAEYTEDEALHTKYINDPSILVVRHLGRNRYLSNENKLTLARMTDDQDTLAALANKTDNEELFLIAAEKITSSHADDPIRCHSKMLARPAVRERLRTHPLASIRFAVERAS